MQWTDEIRLAFLDLWMSFAKYPWFYKMGGSNKKMARDTINQLLDTKTVVLKGETIPLKEVSTSWETVYDNLSGKVTATGKGKGFSFSPLKPFLEYVDDQMKGKYYVKICRFIDL